MPEVEQVDRYDASLFRLSFIFPPISRACGFPLETIWKDPRKKASKEVSTGDERKRKGQMSIDPADRVGSNEEGWLRLFPQRHRFKIIERRRLSKTMNGWLGSIIAGYLKVHSIPPRESISGWGLIRDTTCRQH